MKKATFQRRFYDSNRLKELPSEAVIISVDSLTGSVFSPFYILRTRTIVFYGICPTTDPKIQPH